MALQEHHVVRAMGPRARTIINTPVIHTLQKGGVA